MGSLTACGGGSGWQYNAPVTPRTPLPLRPPRWSIHLLCGLSLLIFLLAMGIWVRSNFVHDVFDHFSGWSDSRAGYAGLRLRQSSLGWNRGSIGFIRWEGPTQSLGTNPT